METRILENQTEEKMDNDMKLVVIPRPSSYPLCGPKYPLLVTIYPQLRVQGRSWYMGDYRKKIPIYPVFYLLKGEYTAMYK